MWNTDHVLFIAAHCSKLLAWLGEGTEAQKQTRPRIMRSIDDPGAMQNTHIAGGDEGERNHDDERSDGSFGPQERCDDDP